MGLELTGMDSVQKALADMQDRLRLAAEGAMYLSANNIIIDAVERTPQDHGALRASGYATLPVRTGDDTTVEIGYGGPAASYAVVQHEGLNFRHEVGEARFLDHATTAWLFGGGNEQMAKIATVLFTQGASSIPPGSAPLTPDNPAAHTAAAAGKVKGTGRKKAGGKRKGKKRASKRAAKKKGGGP